MRYLPFVLYFVYILHKFLSIFHREKNESYIIQFWPVLEKNFTSGLPEEGTHEWKHFNQSK